MRKILIYTPLIIIGLSVLLLLGLFLLNVVTSPEANNTRITTSNENVSAAFYIGLIVGFVLNTLVVVMVSVFRHHLKTVQRNVQEQAREEQRSQLKRNLAVLAERYDKTVKEITERYEKPEFLLMD